MYKNSIYLLKCTIDCFRKCKERWNVETEYFIDFLFQFMFIIMSRKVRWINFLVCGSEIFVVQFQQTLRPHNHVVHKRKKVKWRWFQFFKKYFVVPFLFVFTNTKTLCLCFTTNPWELVNKCFLNSWMNSWNYIQIFIDM